MEFYKFYSVKLGRYDPLKESLEISEVKYLGGIG
jgi:hypothetical protein